MKRAFRFKDKRMHEYFQEALSDFESAMNKAKGYSTGHGKSVVSTSGNGWSFSLPYEMFELVPVFDPNDWNAYPEVTPPAYQRMRLEILYANPDECGLKEFLGCAFFDGEEWSYANTGKTIKIDPLDDVRFRPWE